MKIKKQEKIAKKGKRNKKREIDKNAKNINSFFSDAIVAVSKKRVRTWQGVFIIAFVAGVVCALVLIVSFRINTESEAEEKSLVMEKMKKKGCVADGLLSGYGGDTDNLIGMINRSECEYLHRALETWADAPDFSKAEANIAKITKPNVIKGMFLAEALNPEKKYQDPETGDKFDFSKMCKPGSRGAWGKSTCKADMNNKEYRKYLMSITRRSMDLGITSFLFGQVYLQEGPDLSDSKISEVLKDMRKYGKNKNLDIVIGAQTNTITDEKYLKQFDYIEGGVGQTPSGNIDEGPCDKYYSDQRNGWCWGLLWNKKFSDRANSVMLHLDWSGAEDDDMSVFSKMAKEDRMRILYKFHKYFNSKGIGFLMPFLAVINSKNPGCWGPNREFYAPGNEYSCGDEDDINAILKGIYKGNDAKFISRNIPGEMEAEKKYTVSVTYLNSGKLSWSQKNNYRLGAQNPEDNVIWGRKRVEFGRDEVVESGRMKTFVFEVTAPERAGIYTMDWQMVADELEWFGEETGTSKVAVTELLR